MAQARSIPTVAVTPGEPAGIGPDLVLLLAQRALPCRVVAIADPDLLRQRATQLRLDIAIDDWRGQEHRVGHLAVAPVFLRSTCKTGYPEPVNARYVLDTLDAGLDGCMKGEFAALVTGPVHKGVINDAGLPFTGHTEYLADKSGAETPVMVLVADGLRVALATTHLPLSEVPGAITTAGLRSVINVLHAEIGTLAGTDNPRIAVCGLNPHAGEGGHLGSEETRIIEPLIASLRTQGWRITGPHSADTIFTPALRGEFDVILAMYHDQGLPALKALGFGNAVNVTLGLPIVRTSVDHGTALERAGTGHVDTGSLYAALELALTMVRHRAY